VLCLFARSRVRQVLCCVCLRVVVSGMCCVVCLRVVMYGRCCVVFLFNFSSSCVCYVAILPGCSIFDYSFWCSLTFIYTNHKKRKQILPETH
jgi:hypothetical protein